MAPFDKLVKEAEEEDAKKEDACLDRIEFLRKKFAEIAHQKGRCKAIDNSISDLLTNNTHSDDTSDNELDNDGIYGRMDNDEDDDFSYHSPDVSAKEDENDQQVLGQNTVGTLPLATNCNNGQEYVLLDWQYKIKHIKQYGKAELISCPHQPNFSVHCLQQPQKHQ